MDWMKDEKYSNIGKRDETLEIHKVRWKERKINKLTILKVRGIGWKIRKT